MHISLSSWVRDKIQGVDLTGKSVLEIGAMDINGGVKTFFKNCNYTGIDMREGTGVDIVQNAHDLSFPDSSFDIVLCLEVLEHDDKFWLTLQQIKRVLKKDGFLFLTTRSNGFPKHDFPCDYYRFDIDVVETLMSEAGCAVLEKKVDPQFAGFFSIGAKE